MSHRYTEDPQTVEDRFFNAIHVLRREGTAFRFNVRSPSAARVTEDDLGGSLDMPYGFTLGGSGQALAWVRGMPVNRAAWRRIRQRYSDSNHAAALALREPVTEVYIHHGAGAGQHIYEVFVGMDFQVEWDGSEGKAIRVIFPGAVEPEPPQPALPAYDAAMRKVFDS